MALLQLVDICETSGLLLLWNLFNWLQRIIERVTICKWKMRNLWGKAFEKVKILTIAQKHMHHLPNGRKTRRVIWLFCSAIFVVGVGIISDFPSCVWKIIFHALFCSYDFCFCFLMMWDFSDTSLCFFSFFFSLCTPPPPNSSPLLIHACGSGFLFSSTAKELQPVLGQKSKKRIQTEIVSLKILKDRWDLFNNNREFIDCFWQLKVLYNLI